MKKNLTNLILGGALGISLCATSAFAGNQPKEPNPYIKLSKDQIFEAQDPYGEKFTCGEIDDDVWTPVEKKNKKYISYANKIKELRKTLNETKSSRKQKKLKEQIKTYKKNLSIRQPICLLGKGATDPVTFDFSNSVGMLHGVTLNIQNLSNLTDIVSLLKFDENGNAGQLVKSGTITSFTYSLDPFQPSKAYIQLLMKVNPQNPAQLCSVNSTNCCSLLEVDMESGNVTACIDNYVSLVKDFKIRNMLGTVFNVYLSKTNINLDTEEKVSSPTINVQSDRQGNIFYVGYLKNGNEVLARRQPNGNINYFYALKDMDIDAFYVIDDSEVLVAYTSRHKKGGLIRINMTNGQIVEDYQLEDTPTALVSGLDGYIYVGVSSNYNDSTKDYDIKGIRRFDMVNKTLETQMYIGYNNTVLGALPIVDLTSMCSEADHPKYLCEDYAHAMTHFTFGPAVDSLNIYGISKGDVGEVVRLNNGVRAYKSGIKYKTGLKSLPNNKLVVTGYGLDGYKTVIVTPGATSDTDTIQTILSGANQYDISHMDYVAKNNTLHLIGTRISDNKSVLIIYDLTNNQIKSETERKFSFVLSAQTYFPERNDN